jgi:hypothetical protein
MAMNRPSTFAAFLFFLTFILFASCLEDLENLDKLKSTTFKPRIEFPLVNSEFTMKDFLTEGQSKARITERSGVMVLTYDDTITTPGGENYFSLPDQQSPTIAIQGPEIAFPSPGGSVTINRSVNFAFNSSNGQVLDSIQMKGGSLPFVLDSNFPANITLTVRIPSLETNGTAYQQNFTMNGPSVQNPTRDLQGSTFDLTANGTTSNRITFEITATITDTGQPIDNTHRLNCSFRIEDMAFRGLFGDLGSVAFSLPLDSIEVDIFGNAITAGSFQLLSPSIELDMANSFGLPVGFNILNMGSIKADGTTVALSGPAVSSPTNPYLLMAPSMNQVGQSVTTPVDLNSGNSNLPQLLSSLPRYLTYRFGLALNPNASTKNFVIDDSKLSIGVHLDLPFHGSFTALTVTKNYEFDGLGIDDLAESKIVVKTINETPLEAQVQVYFLDAGGNVLETLFVNPAILDGAPVNASAETQGESSVTTNVTLTNEKIDRMNQATTLQIVATMFTTDSGSVPVKFSAIDKLKVSIGVNTQVEYKVN